MQYCTEQKKKRKKEKEGSGLKRNTVQYQPQYQSVFVVDTVVLAVTKRNVVQYQPQYQTLNTCTGNWNFNSGNSPAYCLALYCIVLYCTFCTVLNTTFEIYAQTTPDPDPDPDQTWHAQSRSGEK